MPTLPADLIAALASRPEVQERFLRLPPSHQKEYLRWIEEAKKSETRTRRIAQTLEMVMEDKV